MAKEHYGEEKKKKTTHTQCKYYAYFSKINLSHSGSVNLLLQ